MYHYKHCDNISKKIEVTNAYLVSVGSLKKADVLLENLRLTLETDLSLTSTIFVSHCVDVCCVHLPSQRCFVKQLGVHVTLCRYCGITWFLFVLYLLHINHANIL